MDYSFDNRKRFIYTGIIIGLIGLILLLFYRLAQAIRGSFMISGMLSGSYVGYAEFTAEASANEVLGD